MVEFLTTALLSKNKSVGSSIGMPIIWSLYHCAWIISAVIFEAMDPKPKADYLTIFCHFKYYIIGAQHMNNNIPVCDHCVTWFPVWSAFKKTIQLSALTKWIWKIWRNWFAGIKVEVSPICSLQLVPPAHTPIMKYKFWLLVFLQICKYMKYCL